ncbi:E3 ubiquitin-protein ligase TRIM39-like [Bombina bombina]|uniref:E3 ubiquitin-protein ligase TRIM39-like n=1 Tax=Bombina bombina TaxID=8345 RepID=UPI00235AA9CC|nr:E3 ubiquitin-protein ligase TRIM39-like [Bombina bombina]
MASADLREELTCSICLSIYTDPVTLSCGHNFCLPCIESVLGTQEDSGDYTCPECRKKLIYRPEMQRNVTLCNLLKHLLPSYQETDTGIFCTYCIHPAFKSCLLCEASFCDFHLRRHSKSDEHILTEPTTSWGNRKCSIHKKLLEYYCTKDAACICVSCSLAGEHRGHQLELLNEASQKKKNKLRNLLQKLTRKREKTEKRVQSLQEHRRGVQEKAAGVTERLTALIRDIRKQLEDLEKRALSDITRQQEQVLLTISDLIQQLEKEKDELTSKMFHIEELCNMTDPLTVLQEQESHRDDFCGAWKGDNELTQRGDKQVPAWGDLAEGLISVTLYRGLADIVTDVKKGFYMQVTSDILMDMNTANNNVIVSGDCKSASWSIINQERPETPERFTDASQVLSTRSFSSGRHYWEVQTSESGDWSIGFCYPSMQRRGTVSHIGNMYWILSNCHAENDKHDDDDSDANNDKDKDDEDDNSDDDNDDDDNDDDDSDANNDKDKDDEDDNSDDDDDEDYNYDDDVDNNSVYDEDDEDDNIDDDDNDVDNEDLSNIHLDVAVPHKTIYTSLHQSLSCDRVGILLDYEAGRLSFYELCDPIRHLHTFIDTFTEPLHAAFWVCGDGAWVRIMS